MKSPFVDFVEVEQEKLDNNFTDYVDNFSFEKELELEDPFMKLSENLIQEEFSGYVESSFQNFEDENFEMLNNINYEEFDESQEYNSNLYFQEKISNELFTETSNLQEVALSNNKSPSCDISIAIPSFDTIQKSKINAPLLTLKESRVAIEQNKIALKKININPEDILIDLSRYINLNEVKNTIENYNINHPNSKINIDSDSIFAEAVNQFQKKIFIQSPFKKGIIGIHTLHSLGITSFPFIYNENPNAKNELKKLNIKIEINGKECNYSNWFSFTYNPSFLGITFNKTVHYLLIKQLRIAEAYLLSLPRFKGLNIAELGKALGLTPGTEQHAGGRNKGGGMHTYGLALDINHNNNPWIGAGFLIKPKNWDKITPDEKQKKYPKLLERYKFLEELKKASGLNLYGNKITDYLNYIGETKGKETKGAFLELKKRNEEFIAYLKSNSSAAKYWHNSATFEHGNPLNGFLNLDIDLVHSLRHIANLAWGAIDFGIGEGGNGDIMHFDLRALGIGRKINLGKTPAGGDPIKTHPYLLKNEQENTLYENYENENQPNFYAENEGEYQMEDEFESAELEMSDEYKVDSDLGISEYLNVSTVKNKNLKTGVFIPSQFVQERGIDIIIYLHGLFDQGDSKYGIAHYWKNYSNIREYFSAGNKNAILIAPTLGSNPQTSDLIFRYKNGLDQFVNQCLKELIERQKISSGSVPGKIIIAAHSAGGFPMSMIFRNENALKSNITEAWGFDCFYNYQWEEVLIKNSAINFYHYWAYQPNAKPSGPAQRGNLLAKKFSNLKNIQPKVGIYHRGVIEYAWKNEINTRQWFTPLNNNFSKPQDESYFDNFENDRENEYENNNLGVINNENIKVYLTLNGQKQGQIKGSGKENAIAIHQFQHEAFIKRDISGMPLGGRIYKPLIITKDVDKSSVILMNSFIQNENLNQIIINFWRTLQNKEVNFYRITIPSANISNISQVFETHNSLNQRQTKLIEKIELNFQKIEWDWLVDNISAEDREFENEMETNLWN